MAKLKSTDIYGNLLVQGKTVLGVDATKDGKQIATEEYVDSEIETISLTPGPPGTAPEHGWSGTQLRFKNPNGTWGSYVNLKGTDGSDANVTTANVKSAGAVMTTDNQSISGTKTFTGTLKIGNNEMTADTVTLDGSTTVALQVKNSNGYIGITPLNASWAHIYTDRNNFIFNKDVATTTNAFRSYNNNLVLKRATDTKLTLGTNKATFVDDVYVGDNKLATEDFVTGKGYLTAHQSLADYAKKNNETFVGDTTIGGLKITGATKNLLGTNTAVTDFQSRKVWFSEGALFYGTAAAAGLLTRGISGIHQAGSSKDNLYINYDGDNTYRTNRHLVLQAGAPGTHYGNNLYQYAAARGDAVKDWVEAKNYITSSALSGYATETFVNEKYNVVKQTYAGQSTISFQSSHAFKTILSEGLIEKYKIESDSTYNFPIGTEITVIQMYTTEVEFIKDSVVTLRSVENKTKIAARYQAVTAKKIAANDWILIGALK